MGWDDIQGFVRHGLTSIAGGLVTKGFIDADQSQQLVGALMALAGLAWSLYNKRQHRKALAAAATQK